MSARPVQKALTHHQYICVSCKHRASTAQWQQIRRPLQRISSTGFHTTRPTYNKAQTPDSTTPSIHQGSIFDVTPGKQPLARDEDTKQEDVVPGDRQKESGKSRQAFLKARSARRARRKAQASQLPQTSKSKVPETTEDTAESAAVEHAAPTGKGAKSEGKPTESTTRSTEDHLAKDEAPAKTWRLVGAPPSKTSSSIDWGKGNGSSISGKPLNQALFSSVGESTSDGNIGTQPRLKYVKSSNGPDTAVRIPRIPKEPKPDRVPKEKHAATESLKIQQINVSGLAVEPIDVPQPVVPTLSYGLERVLFNPGVYQLQDPRSHVYNFDPYLKTIMPVEEFDFNALKEYITSSKDNSLATLAKQLGKRYVGSTSSMTSMLSHFHYLISQWRPINTEMLSQQFPITWKTFTALQRTPCAIFLKWQDGSYAIDADKEFDSANVLQLLGRSMEKLLTLKKEDYERYRKTSSDPVDADTKAEPEAYHYSTLGDFLMRSQLDAYDPRLPGTGMFDLKTRAVVSVRLDVQNFEELRGYEIRKTRGEYESFEKEYYDMIRAAFLKYSLQVRMGRMDGIFVAYHNTARIFGFQYIPLEDMDLAIHGQSDLALGDQEFKASVKLLNEILDQATSKFPEQSLRIHFETRDATKAFMYVFAEPVTNEEMLELQSTNKAAIEQYERDILGLHQNTDQRWDELNAQVEEVMDRDEQGVEAMPLTTGAPLQDSPDMSSTELEQDKPDTNQSGELNAEISGISDSGGDVDPTTRSSSEGNREVEAEGEAEKAAMVDSPSTEPVQPMEHMDAESGDLAAGRGEDATADSTYLDQMAVAAKKAIPKGREDKLLAMTLTIQNRVNGAYVDRPADLKSPGVDVDGHSQPGDQWIVEYSLKKVVEPSRAWALYRATQQRRKKTLGRDVKKDDSEEGGELSYADRYLHKLRELSMQGIAWRKSQDEKESGGETHILGK